jgi:hypothetical protein
MSDSEKKTNSETPPSLKGCGWGVLICGILTNVVLFFAGHIAFGMHNAAMPLVFIFMLVLLGVTFASIAISNREYILVALGIVLLLPSVAVFFRIVFNVLLPFYIQYFKEGWDSIP